MSSSTSLSLRVKKLVVQGSNPGNEKKLTKQKKNGEKKTNLTINIPTFVIQKIKRKNWLFSCQHMKPLQCNFPLLITLYMIYD